MERKRASDFDPQLLHLFDKYVHGAINRREFLEGAAKFAWQRTIDHFNKNLKG